MSSHLPSSIGFGGASLGNLGHVTTDDEARAAVHAAWDAGIRYFDTAPHYGLGLSESRLGDALRYRPRAGYMISTKVGRLLERNPAPTGSDAAHGFHVPDDLVRRFDFTRDGVLRSLEASLGRLGLDRVDIVYVHDPDDHVDAAATQAIPTLIRLRDEGVIGAVGVGMNQWQAPLELVRRTDLDVVMLAGRWTLLDRSGEPLLDECDRRGVEVIAAAPFNSGLLVRDRPDPHATYDYRSCDPDVLARALRLADICAQFGVRLPQAALQFPLRHPLITRVVPGMRTSEQVASTMALAVTPVPEAAWVALDHLG